MSSPRKKWQETGGKARAALHFSRQNTLVNNSSSVTDDGQQQQRKAKSAYIGLFLLTVTVVSSILISAIFSLRVNRESCEHCPELCTCRGSAPAWG